MKILHWDVETMPNMAAVWGKYEQDVLWYEQEGYMFCYAYKWGNEKRTHVVGLDDFKGFKKNPRDDKALIASLFKLFEEADVLVAHNGDSFDMKVANARFLIHGFSKPSPSKTVDTLKVARRNFKLNSNKLDDLGRVLGVGRKERTGGVDLWYDVYHHDPKAIKKMKSYNKQDVVLLEKVYLKLLPWITNHPHVGFYDGKLEACSNCGSSNLQKRGVERTKTSVYQRVWCIDCHAWMRSRVTLDKPKPMYV